MKIRDSVTTTRLVRLDEGELGAKLRELNVTARELSKRTGIKLGLISSIKKGKVEVNLDTAKKICKALGTDLSDLFGTAFD